MFDAEFCLLALNAARLLLHHLRIAHNDAGKLASTLLQNLPTVNFVQTQFEFNRIIIAISPVTPLSLPRDSIVCLCKLCTEQKNELNSGLITTIFLVH